jgi:hypothetical protein
LELLDGDAAATHDECVVFPTEYYSAKVSDIGDNPLFG